VHPVDLAHSDPDGRAPRREEDRVGLHAAARPPGELQVGERVIVGGLTRDEAPPRDMVAGLRRRVGRLHEQPTADLPPLDAWRPAVLIERAPGTVLIERASGTVLIERASGTVLIERAPGTVLIERASDTVLIERASGTTIQPAEQALVLLLRENLHRAGLIVRRDNHLGEDLRDLAGKLGGDRPVRSDHPAERGNR